MTRKHYALRVIVFLFFAAAVVACKKGTVNDSGSGNGGSTPAGGNPVVTPTGTPVSIWMTTGDQTKLLQNQANAYFAADAGTNPATITVDDATTFQSIDGYGFTLTEGSAKLISAMAADAQATLLTDLFSPTNGIGISVVRIGVGATDMSESTYTYQDNGTFSLAGPDLDYLIPILKKVLAVNPAIKVLATAWSAPVSMKSNGSFTGGTLKAASYDPYGQYWLDYMNAMKAQGITIWAITPQNEPENANNTPSMTLTKENELGLINDYIGPKLRGAGFTCKIIGYDHNCDDSVYPTYIAANSTYVDGTAFHLYSGNITAMSNVQSATNKNVYFTEQYTASTGDFSGDLMWHIQNVVIGSMNNMGKTALEWNLANDPSYGPHTNGGCSNCKGAVTLNGSAVTRNVGYYIIAQASKFVKPNAVRITSNSYGSILTSAFKNTDGGKVLIAQNTGSTSTDFKLKWGTQSLTYTLPAKSVTTFTW